MDKMEEYKWILINKQTGEFYCPHNSETIPRNGQPDKIEWIDWNKPLPEDIDTKLYTVSELEEWYTDNYDENGELKAV